MTPFERHNIKHLSPSSLRLYREEPAAWVVRYLMGVKDEMGASAWRGRAVEAGCDRLLFQEGDGPAHDAMHDEFEKSAQGVADDKTVKERADLVAYLAQCRLSFKEMKWPTPLTRQTKISIELPGVEVPLIGFADWTWSDFGVDLKTTQRMPSAAKPEHIEQVACYMEATGKPFSLLYVTPKKWALYPVTEHEARDAMVRVRRGAAAVRALLDRCRNSGDALSIFSPDMSSWNWSPEMILAANKFYAGAAA